MTGLFKILLAGTAVLMIAGCGGNSGTSEGGPDSVTGGPPSAPGMLSLDARNEIKKNSYYNHYTYTAMEGEKLFLDAFLENAITKDMRVECQENGDTFIEVYDAEMNQMDNFRTCTSKMSVIFMADGTYIFKIQYPGNEGYFSAESSTK